MSSSAALSSPKPRKYVQFPGASRGVMMSVSPDEPAEAEEVKNPVLPSEPPEWLDYGARAIFAARVTELQRAGYWSPLFTDSLALYSPLASEYRQDPGNASAAKVTQMRLLLSELGMTPQSSRGVITK